MDPFLTSLAYKHVAVALMLIQANITCDRLNLTLPSPISIEDLRGGGHVSVPPTNYLGGSLVTEEFFFGFGQGHAANFKQLKYAAPTPEMLAVRNESLAKEKSLIDSPTAVQLATNWLASLGADVVRMESNYARAVIQWQYVPKVDTQGQLRDLKREPMKLPVFQIEWTGQLTSPSGKVRIRPVVTVVILGSKKELIEFSILDNSLFKDSPVMISDHLKFLQMADADFLSLPEAQQAALVATHGGKPDNADLDGQPTGSASHSNAHSQ